jgi:hypothetical protein
VRALLFALTLAAGPALGQSIHRCGNTWSDMPCPGAVVPGRPSKASHPPVPDRYHAADLQACHSAVRERLVDPTSAVFGPPIRTTLSTGQRNYVLPVNARNRMGGYSGREQWVCFVSDATGVVLKVIR